MADKLGQYKGTDVITAGVSIRNAGDGLSEAMHVQPVGLPIHSTVHVVLECEVTKHQYEEIKDTPSLTLIHVLKAGRATLVDRELVEKYLDEQEERIAEAEGQPMLTFVEGDEGGEILEDD